MEKHHEDSNAVVCLSQSYNDGIQKIVGNEQAIPFDFEVPQHILERRKLLWNGLFQKYSSMVSEVAFNIKTMKPQEVKDMQEVMEKPTEPRMPMRKSMSMVQYWVDTGNQPYMENVNDRTHSDPGSSLAEEEIVELDEVAILPSASINSSLKRRSETVGVSNSKLMRIASSSSSSVDTAAYILANNNTTKQAETLAIVEGSKVDDKKQNNLLQPLNLVNSVNSINTSGNKIEMYQKHFLSENTVKRRDNTLKVNHLKKNVSKTNDDHQEFDVDATEIVSDDSIREQANGHPSILVSESDESVIKSRLSTGVQRKKLYKNTESPAEFTPASEAASSHRAPRLSIKQCEHPAFQTPKLSRPSYLVRRARQRFRKKKNRNSLSIKMSLSKTDVNKTSIKHDSTKRQSNISEKSKTKNSQEKNKTKFDNLTTNQNKPDKNLNCSSLDNNSNDSRLGQQPLDRRKRSDVKISLDYSKRFDLKTVYLTLHKLPYIYGMIKTYSDDAKNSINKIQREKEEKKLSSINQNGIREQNIAFSGNELSNESYRKLKKSRKRYTQSPTQQTTPKSTEKSNLKTRVEKILAFKENGNNGESIIADTSPVDSEKSNSVLERVKVVETETNNVLMTSQNKSAVENPHKDKNKIVYDKSVKYVLVLSSSDESESIIPLSSKKIKKRSLKRKTNIDEKLDDSSEHEAEKLLLNLNRKNSSKLKSTELMKSHESDKAIAFNSTVDQQTISQFVDKEKILPVKKKLVDSKSKIMNNKDKASAVAPGAKKNVQRITDTLSSEKEQVSTEIESQNKNKNEAISTKLINKPLKRINKTNNLDNLVEKIRSKSNNDKNSRDSLLTKKQEKSPTQSDKLFKEKNNVAKKIELSPVTKGKHSVQNKEAILDKDCQDLKESNSNRSTIRKSKRNTTKENKLSLTNKSKRKTDEFLILSDDECIIPLKMKAQGK
ncbi:general transcriptional corepressor trfA [Nasonia vitripennis]|uniref:Uncharacterized protein n=1 Tax=Nasonia vitripennis TaxID=7425 RepID=A0A7M7INI9_NASVI|nr:general transcriptional corepressor trfA [Nasonia vitripennis]XP_016839759.1 general transcriptional corepressor trfA [Nasonia vitripennis]